MTDRYYPTARELENSGINPADHARAVLGIDSDANWDRRLRAHGRAQSWNFGAPSRSVSNQRSNRFSKTG